MSQKKDDGDLIAEFKRSVYGLPLGDRRELPTRLLVRIAELLDRLYRPDGRPPKSWRAKASDRRKLAAGREQIADLESQGFEPDEALDRVALNLKRSAFPKLALSTIKDRLQRRR